MGKDGDKSASIQYFGPEQEQAVIDYVNSTDAYDRNIIYNKSLRTPLNKMVEYIIKRYNLNRKGMTFDEIHMDTLSYLILKADKFDGSRNYKAYSYYGTIAKRYLIGKLIEDEKYMKKYDSFDDVCEELENRSDFIYEIDQEPIDIDLIIANLIVKIKEEITNADLKKITENEIILGNTLIDVLDNKEFMVKTMAVGNKYNKIAILETIRNHSGLSTKDIRLAMKRYKSIYSILKTEEE